LLLLSSFFVAPIGLILADGTLGRALNILLSIATESGRLPFKLLFSHIYSS